VAVKVAPPLLLMDVDGVLNPYPGSPAGYGEYVIFSEDEEPVRLCPLHGDWLRELAGHFNLVWATSWGEAANLHLCPFFGLSEFPGFPFPPTPFEASAKVPAIDSFVGDNPVAWVDDMVTVEARVWARERTPPTLLVEVDPALGLTRDAIEELLAWRLALS
jgi:HAD domain in Swiss Army Knife RNA repair proteins